MPAKRQRRSETRSQESESSDALDDAAFLYNTALDALKPVALQPDAEQLQLPRGQATACSALRACIQALEEAAADEHKSKPACSATAAGHANVALAVSCGLRLRQLLCLSRCLLGRLIEWRASSDAMRLYDASVSVFPCFESCFQKGRLMLKMACTRQQVEAAQKMLERASSYEAADCSSCDEASMMLMRLRLMDPLVWGHALTSSDDRRQRQQQADLQQLKLMGFRHALSPQVLIPPFAPCPLVRHSDRVRSCHVSAFEDSLQVAMCFHGARMARCSLTSLYSLRCLRVCEACSARTVFSSVKTTTTGANEASCRCCDSLFLSPGTGFFSFCHDLRSGSTDGIGQILHSVWVRACSAIPAAKRARYAEWWAHCRPHSNGHKLHFDFVQPPHAKRPLHPLASTITFVSADCGGPTLITDQRVGGTTSKGWLVEPKANRLVVFDGSLLHCVLPGCGVHASADKRRITFMVALWEHDPCAPRFPDLARAHAAGLKWPAEFSRRIDGCTPEAVRDVSADLEAVKVVTEVTVPVEGKRPRFGVDIMGEDVFTFFEALEPNVVTSAASACSLNCGGTCDFCKQLV